MVLYNVIYYLLFAHYLPHRNWMVASLVVTPKAQAFIIATIISNPIGFLLSRYVVFTESNVRGRIQAFRYALLVGTCLFLNYAFLKVFSDWCGIYPPVASVMTTAIVAVFSYVSQRNFTFKTKEAVIK